MDKNSRWSVKYRVDTKRYFKKIYLNNLVYKPGYIISSLDYFTSDLYVYFPDDKTIVSTYIHFQYKSSGHLDRFKTLYTTTDVYYFSHNKYTFYHLLCPYKLCRF